MDVRRSVDERAFCLGRRRAGLAPSQEWPRAPIGRSGVLWRACIWLSRTRLTGRSPLAAHIPACFFACITIGQPFARGTTIKIVLRDIDEILPVEQVAAPEQLDLAPTA